MPQPRKLHDRFFKQAKAEGYAARSAYKLLEIQERRRVLSRGDRVLDLGCAPGSWVQAAAKIVGGNGLIIGIDIKPVTIALPPNARTLVADAFALTPEYLGEHAGVPAGARFDAVLSDMAPNTEGGAGGSIDHFRSVDLCHRVLDIAALLLRTGGNLVMKVFEGEAYNDLLVRTRSMFEDVKALKPEASRDVSREMFIIAKGLRATPGAGHAAGAPSGAPPAPAPRPGWGAPKTP